MTELTSANLFLNLQPILFYFPDLRAREKAAQVSLLSGCYLDPYHKRRQPDTTSSKLRVPQRLRCLHDKARSLHDE